MKALEPLSNLFGKRTLAAAPAGAEGKKGAVQKSRNTTIALIVASLLLVAAVGAGVWWWKARHKVAAPVKEAHAPARAIVNAPAAPPAVELPLPVQEAEIHAAAHPEGTQDAASAVAANKPPEADVGHDKHGAVAAVAAPAHEDEAKPEPVHVAAPVIASDTAHMPKAMPAAAPPAVARKKARAHAVRQQEDAPAEARAGDAAQPVTDDLAGSLDKRAKPVTSQQQADIEFRKGVAYMQKGHASEALAAYETALKLDASHAAARQAMVALLLEGHRMDDAERVLREGVKANPQQSAFAMLLARLQVERGSPWSALLTLQDSLPYAKQQADYQAFMAALLQRLEHHKEAVAHYQAALQITPNSGLWLMGLGLSLESMQRLDEARDAFHRAIETHSLNPDLQEFVMQRLKEL